MREKTHEFHWLDHRGNCRTLITYKPEEIADKLSTYNYMFVSFPVTETEVQEK